jgi:hypothetical protein
MNTLFNRIGSFFRALAGYPADSDKEPAQITHSRVLAIVYDPVMDPATGATLSQSMKWYRTSDLLTGFMADLLLASSGRARYEIVQRVNVDEFPIKSDGFRYTPKTYREILTGAANPHVPQDVDYHAILNTYHVLHRVANNEIDEVWVVAFPYAGFYESIMAGPDAFWCNAPPLKDTQASRRRFVIMGFSYERYIGEMLEAYGHRAESIMEKTFGGLTGEANLWQRFIRYDKIAPGRAACGNVHFAPNSTQDYDWDNPRPVQSECYDWLLNFPNFKGDGRTVDASEWGGGDMRKHHIWWFNHFPRVAGRRNNIHNNWWQYVTNPDYVLV